VNNAKRVKVTAARWQNAEFTCERPSPKASVIAAALVFKAASRHGFLKTSRSTAATASYAAGAVTLT
jgi:hypothetical protein